MAEEAETVGRASLARQGESGFSRFSLDTSTLLLVDRQSPSTELASPRRTEKPGPGPLATGKNPCSSMRASQAPSDLLSACPDWTAAQPPSPPACTVVRSLTFHHVSVCWRRRRWTDAVRQSDRRDTRLGVASTRDPPAAFGGCRAAQRVIVLPVNTLAGFCRRLA